ncbi:cytochrome c biogenesis protein CcsA [Pelagicoccus sp. NFK12]|uniref:Cytochrome c biogenesis protein CcsA n=1 Tax=Pelagicoccus enzymogenes TaxID=2773457 RepID=A0A927IID3_9BACT|nr:cytochrome c biogenesis protein CcsA [Pelagicoccus enzymogenes]MBD5780375.1 cytochrome c biogenesis protein CcsA [Pelagicoccus enzymogenes]MDQ8197722.1 cytochrome c biogenesis protein CcsA [Pelagicoccus enzymogenes]
MSNVLLGLADKQWIWIATVVFASTFVLGSYSALKLRRKTGRPYILGLVTFGWVLQTIGLYARGLQYGGCPLSNQFELVQFMVWSAIAIYIFVGPAFRVSLLGVFASGFACVFSILSLALENWDDPSRKPIFGESPWIETHAALALFSYGVFGVLTLTSAMYLLQSRSLKTKKVVGGLFPFLPSIVELVSINRRLLVMGFSILTVSLAIGYRYFMEDLESVLTIKLASTVAVWIAYAITLALRLKFSLTSKKFAWACIGIFLAALLSLAAVNRSTKSSSPTAEPAQSSEVS